MGRAWAKGSAGLAACVAAIVLVVGGGASPAAAHAELLETSPAAGEQLDTAPDQVVLRYSETVDPFDDAIEVFDSDGDQIETTDPGHPPGEPHEVAVDLPELEDGAYVVTWRVASEDSHPIRGAFTFRVGAGGDASAAEAEALMDELSEAEGGDATVGFLFGVVRFVGFVGLVVLVGGALFLAALWPTGGSDPRARRLLVGGWAAALAATVLGFGFQAAYSEGAGLGGIVETGPIGDVFGSRPGRVWLVRLVLLALVAVVGVVVGRRWKATGGPAAAVSPSGPDPAGMATTGVLASVVVVGLGLLATISMAGHAGSGDLVGLAIAADLVHLGGVSFWLGGLALLFVAVLRTPGPAPARVASTTTSTVGAAGVTTTEAELVAADDPTPVAAPPGTASVVDRFSTLAFVAVVAIVVSGTVQGWRQLRTFDALVDSTYGRVLIVKVLLFAAMLAAAAVSRAWVRRRQSLSTGAAGSTAATPTSDESGDDDGGQVTATATDSDADADDATDAGPADTTTDPPPPPLRSLRLSVGIEAGIAALVLGVTALLVNTVPGKDTASPLFSSELHGSAVMVQVKIEPAVAGVLDVRITTLTHSGEPTDPPSVEASLSLPERDVPPIPLRLEPSGDGVYVAEDADIPFPGTWTLEVDVRVSEFDQDALSVEVPIK